MMLLQKISSYEININSVIMQSGVLMTSSAIKTLYAPPNDQKPQTSHASQDLLRNRELSRLVKGI